MPQRASSSSSLMRPFVVLALPGMYLLYKYNQYRQQQMETARRRVTERELMHLNTKIVTPSSYRILTNNTLYRGYKKRHDDDGCRRACVDIPPEVDPVCPEPCNRWGKKKNGILHKIKLKIMEGGSNFGTPFRSLECKEKVCKEVAIAEPKALPDPSKKTPSLPPPRPGVQISIIGADTNVGQYIALLLKQCPCVKKLRLYEAKNTQGSDCSRDICKVVQDIQHIDTNCIVEAFSCVCNEIEKCLQNSDIVVILESGDLTMDMPLETRFCYQAPIVKQYADAIAKECPNAFIVVCTSPIDCMVPLIAQTLKETGWYNPRKLLGSLAVPEMRASTLAARGLSLEPGYVHVPCVGGTEGSSLVPLFSRALEYFDFSEDKLLNKLEENEPELATSPEEECVICVNAKATMQTSPCGHRVVCRRCFVKTIQMAVSQRLLPLRCVICRAKILRLRQAPRLVSSKSWQISSGSEKSWGVPGSVSSYSVGARSVPASASLYSVTSGESSLSGVSSVSSNSGANVSNTGCSTKLCGGAKCGGACLGAVPRVPATSTPPRPRQPASNSLRRSQHHSMKARLQDYQMHSYTGGPAGEPSGRLPPIREFQREFREGRRESAAAASASTRIRCAQKIVTQLETSPQKNKQHFFRPLKPTNKDDPPNSRDHSIETDKKKENPKIKVKKDEKKKKETDENAKQTDKNKKDESNDNKKNENAERKKEEKLRLKAEKEAKKEAKLQAKEEERQAKLLAKEEERQAKILAKEEKKKAKKEAKLAAQAEKEKR